MNPCRLCSHPLSHEFVDLVNAPPSNSFLHPHQINEPEAFYPLKLYVCEKCFLVQIEEYKAAVEIFSSDYVYFSSYSKSWLEHCKVYAENVTARFNLNAKSKVVEIASNDGYLLQYFKEKGISVLGVEPTASTAVVAIQKGIDTAVRFFGKSYAEELVVDRGVADLIIANNVLAHVPDANDFVRGVKVALSGNGVFTAEFPHLLQMIRNRQFDTIYHEHFSYLSFYTTNQLLTRSGLRIFDVEELPTHGGSLRVYADHGSRPISPAVSKLTESEEAAGITDPNFYTGFQKEANLVKNQFLRFLLEAHDSGKKVVGYGAAAKGNTLLNYCGVKKDLLHFVVDASPHKQGRFLPGSHIPVVDETHIEKTKPDYVVLLPWNLRKEISSQLEYIRRWGGKFVIALPELEVF